MSRDPHRSRRIADALGSEFFIPLDKRPEISPHALAVLADFADEQLAPSHVYGQASMYVSLPRPVWDCLGAIAEHVSAQGDKMTHSRIAEMLITGSLTPLLRTGKTDAATLDAFFATLLSAMEPRSTQASGHRYSPNA
ncbi:Uncharacterised protein [Mycobacteroides abscessus subsp. abscessus]|nr:Uncharacterised protein [Mycobacteroides abscessus subsp. abscessus]